MRMIRLGGPRDEGGVEPVRWAGLDVYRSPYQFQDVVVYNQHTPAMIPQVDRAKLEALIDSVVGSDVVLCEAPEALLLRAEWHRMGIRGSAILALEVEGFLRVNAIRRWYVRSGAEDPWPAVRDSEGISWLAASDPVLAAMRKIGIPESRIFQVRGCTAHFGMSSEAIEEQLSGGLESDEELARGLPTDGVLLPGGGHRDLVTMLRAVHRLPELPFFLVDELLPRKQHQLRQANVPHLSNLFLLKPLPLRRFISLVRRARLVVVGLEPGFGDGGHTTVATAHRVGVPVVATRVPGILDYVTHDSDAILVPPEDPDALASAILSLWGDPQRRRHLATGGIHRERSRCRLAVEQLMKAVERAFQGKERER